MTEYFSNNAYSYLLAALDDNDTTFTVFDGGHFPQSGTFRVRVDDELMLVSSRHGNTFTVTRGVEDTTAASHAIESTVSMTLTKTALENIFVSNRSGTTTLTGSAPVAEQAGKITPTTNGNNIYFDSGSAIYPYNGIHYIDGSKKPILTDFTIVNQQSNNDVLQTTKGVRIFTRTLNGNENICACLRTIPSPPCTLTIGFKAWKGSHNFNMPALIIRNSTGGQVLTYGNLFKQNQADTTLQMRKVLGMANCSYISDINPISYYSTPGITWLRYVDNGLNRYFYYGHNKDKWLLIGSESRTNTFTADQWGFGTWTLGGTSSSSIHCFYYSEEGSIITDTTGVYW